jgi:hypothetical protein
MPNKDEEAQLLAEAHYRMEAGIKTIFRITRVAEAEVRPNEPIKLLEVNEFTSPSGITPLQFGPAPASGIHFPSVIVEVTPDEYEKIKNCEMPLPNGWSLGAPLPRPTDAGAA